MHFCSTLAANLKGTRMIELKLPPKVKIDKHIPSGYVVLGYTEKEMLEYATELAIEHNKQLVQRVLELELKQSEMNRGWLRVCDEELVGACISVANQGDSYDSAKLKLNSLINWHIAVATDPAVNGGFSLQRVIKGEIQ